MQKKIQFLFIAAALAAGGCAPKNWNTSENGPFDPLEGFNREIYKFNKGLDFVLLKPAATVYKKFPPALKTGVENVFSNLAEPSNAVNNALQKEGSSAINSTARFTINTVLGVGGLVDVADMWEIPQREADFGQTLRSYGLRNTMYFVLPVLGPTTFGDGLGSAGEATLSPLSYVKNNRTRGIATSVGVVNTRAQLLETTELLEEIALDEYLFVRDAYEEQRSQSAPIDLWNK